MPLTMVVAISGSTITWLKKESTGDVAIGLALT